MVSVSVETPAQTAERLVHVWRAAAVDVLPALWAFREVGCAPSPRDLADALAAVRDDVSWSVLAPAGPADEETFRVFTVHFPEGVDNSGFVGWLAGALKRSVGTGVFVICGQSADRGGIYDHWGVPAAVGDAALAVLEELRSQP